MNAVLWVLQGGLALLLLSGGAYKVATRGGLAKQYDALSAGVWGVLGVLEVVAGLLLLVPAATGWLPVMTPLAAIVVAVESAALAGVYARVSRSMSASNPLVFAVVMALSGAVVAFGRLVVSPLA